MSKSHQVMSKGQTINKDNISQKSEDSSVKKGNPSSFESLSSVIEFSSDKLKTELSDIINRLEGNSSGTDNEKKVSYGFRSMSYSLTAAALSNADTLLLINKLKKLLFKS